MLLGYRSGLATHQLSAGADTSFTIKGANGRFVSRVNGGLHGAAMEFPVATSSKVSDVLYSGTPIYNCGHPEIRTPLLYWTLHLVPTQY